MVVSLLHSVFDFLAFKNGMTPNSSLSNTCFMNCGVWCLLWKIILYLIFFNSADIQFWNKNKSMEGLSAKSVVVSFICQLIVFLYLLDNDTSWMILASSGIGCCIEFWKIGKAMHIEVLIIIPDWFGALILLSMYVMVRLAKMKPVTMAFPEILWIHDSTLDMFVGI